MAAEFSEKDINLKIFVGELKKTATEEQLKSHFSANIGPVADVCIKRDEKGASRGIGFVLFENEEDAAVAIHKTEFHVLEGEKILVKRAEAKEAYRKVFVGGLEPSITEEEIRAHFSQYGDIDSVELPVGTRGTRRSFVFVVFKSPAGAIAATATGLKKQKIGEDTVDVRRAVPKDQHQSGHGFHRYGYENLAERKGIYPPMPPMHYFPPGPHYPRPYRAMPPPHMRGRGRARVAAAAAAAAAAAYYDPYGYGYADPYATGEEDPYADPYGYAEDDAFAEAYYPPQPVGGGKIRGRGRGAAPMRRPVRGAPPRGRGGRGAPRGRGARSRPY